MDIINIVVIIIIIIKLKYIKCYYKYYSYYIIEYSNIKIIILFYKLFFNKPIS